MNSQKTMRLFKIALSFGFSCVLLWGVFYLFFWVDKKQETKLATQHKSAVRIPQEQMSLLQEGDIILRRGYGFFSDMIASRLNDSIFEATHSGILYKKANKWYVIHSLSSDVSDVDGMQEQDLTTFLQYSVPEKLLVVRVKNATQQQRKQIVTQGKYYLDKKVAFDHKGRIDDASQLYCTELIWQIIDTDLQLIELPKKPDVRKKIFYSMQGMYDAKYFDIIINTYPK